MPNYNVQLELTEWSGHTETFNVDVADVKDKESAEAVALALFEDDLPKSYPKLTINTFELADVNIPDVFEKFGGVRARLAVDETMNTIVKSKKQMNLLYDALLSYSEVYYKFDKIVEKAISDQKAGRKRDGVWTVSYLRKTRMQAQASAANGNIHDIILCINKMRQVVGED